MASTKAANTTVNETPAVTDPWDVEVSMHVPRRPRGDDPFYYICVNDRRFQVPANGQQQKLPQPVAEILQGLLDAENQADKYVDELQTN